MPDTDDLTLRVKELKLVMSSFLTSLFFYQSPKQTTVTFIAMITLELFAKNKIVSFMRRSEMK